MVFLTLPELALKWSFFFQIGSQVAFEEYLPLFLKQLGFNASQVGFTAAMGLPILFSPLFGLLGDKFRARKLVLILLILFLLLLILAPLLALVSPLGDCKEIRNHSTVDTDAKKRPTNKTFSFKNVAKSVPKTITSNVSLFSLPSSVGSSLSFNNQTSHEGKPAGTLAWSSNLFIFIVITKGLYEALRSAALTSYNVAAMTHLRKERTRYGSYFCWGHIGASFSVFAVGIMALFIKLPICGIIGYGYFTVCLFSALFMAHCLCVVPWVKYEYLDHRVINWSDVRGVVFNFHYLVVLFVGLCIGICFGYQTFWENWYIDELSGGPLIMALCGITRRPFLALWFHLSGRFMSKVGELRAMAAALLLASVSLLALSFIQVPWLVLLVDVFMSAALALSYSAINVHLSKAGSEASSSVILGV